MKTNITGKDRIKVLFIRPPYHLWPIINESDNFLLPLGFPCLGAYLMERTDGIKVKVLDCLPLKIGWRSLERHLKEESPDIVGVGDMTVYMAEGIRALNLARKLVPGVITIAGGHFHSHLPEYSLRQFPSIDYIVRYEGEETLAELIKMLREGGELPDVRSIAYRRNDEVVTTHPRPLIPDLDDLPIPAYDLMPIERYAPFGMLWPKAITIQGGRGCPYNCNFCSWSAQEGDHVLEEGRIKLIPKYRKKGVDRMIQEIELLYEKYHIRYLFWADGTWNLDNEWLDGICTEIIKRRYKIGWWAFVRADLLLEQERLGILQKMVKAGFRHTLIGGERPVEDELMFIGKSDCPEEALKQASRLLERKYPQVFRQATFLTGIRTETQDSIERLGKYSRDAHLDFAAYHPIMPFPGTPLWELANEKGWIEERDFTNYDMFYPIMSSETLSREEISGLTQRLYTDFVGKQPIRYLRGLFSLHSIRRRLHWWFLFSIFRVILRDLFMAILRKKRFEGFAAVNKLWRPKWYDK